MSSLDELVAIVADAVVQIETAMSGVESARSKGEETVSGLAALGVDGVAAVVGQSVGKLAEVSATLLQAKSLAEEASTIAESARGLRTQAPGGAAPPVVVPRNPHRPNPRGPDNRHVDGVRGIGWPLNPDGKVMARGLAFDESGRRLGDVWEAERHGPAYDATQYREPIRSDVRFTIRYHVEGQVAAMMRRDGITNVEVYLNIPPCGKKSRDPRRCHATIEAVMPKGSRMTVWVIRPRSLPQKIEYRGTGKALA